MPFGMKAVEAYYLKREDVAKVYASPMPFGMKAVEAKTKTEDTNLRKSTVTNAFRHEGR